MLFSCLHLTVALIGESVEPPVKLKEIRPEQNSISLVYIIIYVVVQFFSWFKFYFPLFWGMVMYDNEF